MSPPERTVPNPDDLLWDIKQLGAWLGISRRTVIRRVHTGEWPHHKVGNRYRFTADDRKNILDTLTVNPIYPEPPTARVRRLRHDKAS